MRLTPRRVFLIAVAVLLVFVRSGHAAAATPQGPNVRITTADPIASDPYAAAAAPFDVLQQNEPSIAQSPNHPNLLAVAYNDVETYGVTGDAWQGLSLSNDGGATWPDAAQTLIPGYPTDTSRDGRRSPIFGNAAATDPVLAFDDGYLYYSFVAFQRDTVHPDRDGSNINAVAVARYRVRNDGSGVDYDRTVLVRRGTPGPRRQEDKDWISVNPYNGDVYVVYTEFNNNGNTLNFQMSSDRGLTWSRPQRVDPVRIDTQFAVVAGAPNGRVYVAFRSFGDGEGGDDDSGFAITADVAASAHKKHKTPEPAIWIVRSDDGGRHFGNPSVVTTIDDYGQDASDTPPVFRTESAVAIAVANNGNVWLSFDARNSATSGDDVNVICSSDRGRSWSGRKDPASAFGSSNGHQLMSSITIAGDTASVVWYDSRSEPAFNPDGPVTSTGTSGDGTGMDVYYNQLDATRCNARFGVEKRVTDRSFNPNTRGSILALSAFIGDYIQVVADHGNAYVVWTDTRDVSDQSTCEDADPDTNDTTCINNRSRDLNIYFQKLAK